MQKEYDIKSIMEQIEQDLIVRMKRTLWSHQKDEEAKKFKWRTMASFKTKAIAGV